MFHPHPAGRVASSKLQGIEKVKDFPLGAARSCRVRRTCLLMTQNFQGGAKADLKGTRGKRVFIKTKKKKKKQRHSDRAAEGMATSCGTTCRRPLSGCRCGWRSVRCPWCYRRSCGNSRSARSAGSSADWAACPKSECTFPNGPNLHLLPSVLAAPCPALHACHPSFLSLCFLLDKITPTSRRAW